MSYSAGFDWGSTEHAVCVIDDRGQVVLQAKVRHDAEGLAAMLQQLAQMLNSGEPLHMILYAGLIIGFAFFYTALVFNSQETADNLKKSGALIPGIRPGKATADYVDGVLTRLTAAGAIYLVIVCLLP